MSPATIILLCWITVAHSLPPDKLSPIHIIKARSIDLNNAHGLTMETRLEKAVSPTSYRLELEPYLEDGVFKGHVSIGIKWLEDSDEITVHAAHDLEITNTEVKVQGESDKTNSQKLVIRRASSDPKKPIFTIQLEKVITKNTNGNLDISFNGKMQTSVSEGFFRTTYINENETESIVAATALRPNNGRRVFPCFDEPGYMTPFQLSVVRPRNMVALSNVPVEKTEEITGEPNAVWVHFEKTLPMSIYSLGLVITDIKQYGKTIMFKDDMPHNIELRVWGRPEFHPALEGVPAKVEEIFRKIAKYFGVYFPLKKIDIVALPNYQGVKPADSWGLIVFKESDLSSRNYLQLTQELLYQWIGGMTSPAWWSEAHINKALVSFLAADIIFQINNGQEMEGKWPMTILYSLYYEFSKRYPHSRITGMKQETASTKIELIFRMFNYTLGAQTFRAGMLNFLEMSKKKEFTGDQIWVALNKSAEENHQLPKDIDVKTVAESWMSKDRLPLITVQRNYESNSALVTQKVFLRERPHDVPDADRMLWWAPLVLVRGDSLTFTDTTPKFWMKNHKDLNMINMPDKEHFIIVNPEEIAPFPVNYDKENWNLLLKFLQSKNRTQIPELTRAKLLHDAWNLAYAGELSFATALNMTLFLKEEKHHVVWDPLFTMIDHIGKHICQCIQGKFQAYVRSLLTPLYEELIKDVREDEVNWRKNLRAITKTFLCRAGYKPCVREAQQQFSKWMGATNPDEGNPIANQYICPVFKWGTKEEWEFGLKRVINFPSSRKQSERTYLLKTLAGCPEEEYKIIRLLNVTLMEGNANFTETDLFLIFSMLSGSSQGYTTLFHYLNDNWNVLKLKFTNQTSLWNSLISSATSQFTTQEGLELVSKLFVDHQGEFGSAEHIVEKSMRNIRVEVKWSVENLPVIEHWLDDYLKNNPEK